MTEWKKQKKKEKARRLKSVTPVRFKRTSLSNIFRALLVCERGGCLSQVPLFIEWICILNRFAIYRIDYWSELFRSFLFSSTVEMFIFHRIQFNGNKNLKNDCKKPFFIKTYKFNFFFFFFFFFFFLQDTLQRIFN